MKRSIFHISKMDCPSEERIIRLALDGKTNVNSLNFDLANRKLTVIHENPTETLLSVLVSLNLGAALTSTGEISEVEELLETAPNNDQSEMSVLRKVFMINATMFVVGLVGGWIGQSTGLIADSLDMFADASVFGLSMYAVGKSMSLKKRAARISGYLQMLLAIFAVSEVIRRFIYGSEPEASYMMVIAFIALIANATCMFLLAKHRKGEAHMRASWIFLSNDVIADAGVIVAGVLVKFTSSPFPDLIIGAIIGVVVFSGAIRILNAARA